MSKYYLKSLFVNPWVLSGTVMYWHFNENNSFFTLIALISLLLIFHIFDFKKIREQTEKVMVESRNLSLQTLLIFVAFNPLRSDQCYVKAGVLIQVLNIVIVCSTLILVLMIDIDARYSAPIVFFAPFILTYIFTKLEWITFYTIDKMK